jgi:hypothetical protein
VTRDAAEPYTLQTTSTARRALTDISSEALAAAAYEFITGPLLDSPHRTASACCSLSTTGTAPGAALIYRIDDKDHVVAVVDIAHRRDAYRT